MQKVSLLSLVLFFGTAAAMNPNRVLADNDEKSISYSDNSFKEGVGLLTSKLDRIDALIRKIRHKNGMDGLCITPELSQEIAEVTHGSLRGTVSTLASAGGEMAELISLFDELEEKNKVGDYLDPVESVLLRIGVTLAKSIENSGINSLDSVRLLMAKLEKIDSLRLSIRRRGGRNITPELELEIADLTHGSMRVVVSSAASRGGHLAELIPHIQELEQKNQVGGFLAPVEGVLMRINTTLSNSGEQYPPLFSGSFDDKVLVLLAVCLSIMFLKLAVIFGSKGR